MAGHSKWANIRHRKGAQDAKRGKIFTKLGKEITVAAKLGGEDPEGNSRLRTAIAKAKSQSMPKDNIERAIKRGVGGADDSDYIEKTYEGYGPAGVAVLVECLTDNINRTVSEVRNAFSRSGGNLGTDGSVAWMFHKKGSLVFNKKDVKNFDEFFEKALDAGAEEVEEEDGSIFVTTGPEEFEAVEKALIQGLKIPAEHQELGLIPENFSPVDSDKAELLDRLLDTLEDHDDVQNVYHNGQR